MKALFDMSAFTLVPGGKVSIRSMQQYLNSKYKSYFGILPCDGIYQRDTNTALIYAFQVEIGLSSVANGYYGPGTINATPSINSKSGASKELVKILEYALMVNDFYGSPIGGSFTQSVEVAILNFRKFMNLPPYNSTADLTVFKSLLTSNGNVNRDCIAMDTSKQLTDADLKILKNSGYDIIGRYLTGSVGTGINKKNKFLTKTELANIKKNKLKVFPIYQDGGFSIEYFTASQGIKDAIHASKAARTLGFEAGTTIYFAVDVDIEDGDIPGTVLPYIKQVSENIGEYNVGIYGTRNVCSQAINNGYAKNAFVANMSTGFSGNLGFKMPSKWAFDQFVEYTLEGIPVDNVAASGRDRGVNTFNNTIDPLEALIRIFGNFEFAFEKEIVLSDNLFMKISAIPSASIKVLGPNSISITNFKFDKVNLTKNIETATKGQLSEDQVSVLVDKVGHVSFVNKIADGDMSIEEVALDGKAISLKINIRSIEGLLLTKAISITIKIELKPNIIKDKLEEFREFIQNLVPNYDLNKVSTPVLIMIALILFVTLAPAAL